MTTEPTVSDAAFWEGLYDRGSDRWELGRPCPALGAASPAGPCPQLLAEAAEADGRTRPDARRHATGGVPGVGALARATMPAADRVGGAALRREATKDPARAGRTSMAAYVIVDLDVTDPARYAEYRQRVPATVAAYGGRFLVRGGEHQVVEGNWHPRRLVVLEFPSLAKAREWYDSEEYREPKAMRLAASNANLVFVEGT